MLILGLVGLAGLSIQAYVSWNLAATRGVSGLATLSKYLSYFTIIANLLVSAGNLTGSLFPKSAAGEFANRPAVQGALLLYISVVGIVYTAVLTGLWVNLEGLQWWANILLHYVMPLLYVVFWFTLAPKARLPWSVARQWLIVPAIYLVWALSRGAVTNDYPYPFIDVQALGYPKAALGALVVTALFLGGALIIIAISRTLSRRTR